ncbi:MAG: hypothetical protein LBH04_03665 [Tannerellaceae bacterium]|jgi:hypothetical protein|nr:hypothetical protein [Tannerellaceae bacterium]
MINVQPLPEKVSIIIRQIPAVFLEKPYPHHDKYQPSSGKMYISVK